MTTHEDDSTTRILHELDAADRELTPRQRTRAAATLEQILAVDPETPAKEPAVVPDLVRPRRRRLLVLAGGALVAGTAAVLAPMVVGGDEAFASWSSTPVELGGSDRAAALAACLELQGDEEGSLAFDPGADATALLAEARGGWNYVVYTATSSSGRELQGSCLVPDGLVADPRRGEGGFFGGLGGAEETAGREPAPDAAREDSFGVGAVDDGAFVYAEGRAGKDVANIEVTTPRGIQVEASIENGRWAVWWPTEDDMRSPDIREAPTYEVTLRDGTVSDAFRTLQ